MMSFFTSFFSEQGAFYGRVRKITRQVLEIESNCVVIGAGDGKLLDVLLDTAKRGNHYIFEPNPVLRGKLEKRYKHYNCHISAHILRADHGSVQRIYKLPVAVKTGKKGEEYKIIQKQTEVEVAVERLDTVLPDGYIASLIAVCTNEDVDKLLEGSRQVIERSQLHLIFQKGIGGDAQVAASVFRMMADNKLRISTLDRWIGNKPSFREKDFTKWATTNSDTPLIAYP